MNLKFLACSVGLTLFSTHSALCMTASEVLNRSRIDNLERRVVKLEKAQSASPSQKEKPHLEKKKEFIKCNTNKKSCKRVSERKFRHLKNKPVDPNNPTTLAKFKKGRIRPVDRGMGHHRSQGKVIGKRRRRR